MFIQKIFEIFFISLAFFISKSKFGCNLLRLLVNRKYSISTIFIQKLEIVICWNSHLLILNTMILYEIHLSQDTMTSVFHLSPFRYLFSFVIHNYVTINVFDWYILTDYSLLLRTPKCICISKCFIIIVELSKKNVCFYRLWKFH